MIIVFDHGDALCVLSKMCGFKHIINSSNTGSNKHIIMYLYRFYTYHNVTMDFICSMKCQKNYIHMGENC